MKRSFAWVASTRDLQHVSFLTVEPSHASTYANRFNTQKAQAHMCINMQIHVFLSSLSVTNQVLSCVSGMLIFAPSSSIKKNLHVQIGSAEFLKSQVLFGGSFNFMAFHQSLTGISQRARAYNFKLFFL